MADLLFEIGTEELPGWYQDQARPQLAEMLRVALERAGISHGGIHSFSTPRRLALLARGLPERSSVRTEERRGPPASAAYDADGNPTRALTGFAQKNGVTPADLRNDGQYVWASVRSGGEDVAALLPDILRHLVTDLPAPRKMRWGSVAEPFVRPVAWLTARLDDAVLDLQVAGQQSAGHTRGHRFLAAHDVSFTAPADYAAALEAAHVIADPSVRHQRVEQAVIDTAAAAGLVMDPAPDLLDEVTGLVERPFPILGSFDASFLELPDDVLTTVLINHQRFFPLRQPGGRLARHYVGISNNLVADEDVVRRGYDQVLAGRLQDARFFWDEDRRTPLQEHAERLSGVGYQRELGTMQDKVARTARIARRVAAAVGLDAAGQEQLESVLPLFRADLATGMVFEFPELEGTMGRAYAAAEGIDPEAARILEDGMLPRSPDSDLPHSRAGAVLALADKLEKITGFLSIGRRPSGSADPFALRRDAIGLARILSAFAFPVTLQQLAALAAEEFGELDVPAAASFLQERVAALLAEEGLPTGVIRAAAGGQPPVITQGRRAHLLQQLGGTEGFTALAALYKRAANISAGTPAGEDPAAADLVEQAELDLLAALPAAREGTSDLLDLSAAAWSAWDLGHGPGEGPAEADLTAGLQKVLSLQGPLDAFLDSVFVMVDDERLKNARLALLAAVRDTLGRLGDISELS